PNYAGYDTSDLAYHPYLNADQQSKEMVDVVTAARSALPVASATSVTDNHKLFVTGYSQGGFAAMAAQKAMQAAGMTVTAAASMTPATMPAALAPIFAQGFGDPALVNNNYRLSYLRDEQAAPDGGFPNLSTGVPAASPTNTLRQALKTNDLRNWTPTAPVLLCA